MKNKKVLITGATGQVGRPIAQSLAPDNEVWCAARFSDPKLKREVEEIGVKTFRWELGSDDLFGLPADFDYVVHSAWNIFPVANDFEAAIASNVEGTGLLIQHCKTAKALLFISTLYVYQPPGKQQHAFKERNEAYGYQSAVLPSYSPSKIAGEGLVRALARMFNLPTTIARLGAAYGIYGHGGYPIQSFERLIAGEPIHASSRKNCVSLIHEDDIARNVAPLLNAAAVPATIVNWISDEHVDERDMYTHLGKLAGIEPNVIVDDSKAIELFIADPSFRKSITGPSQVSWKEGIRQALQIRFPDREFPETA